jgi:large subunit ribosomal protein L37e
MGKGTPARRGGKIVHVRCRRCGSHSYHRQKRVCAACGFGDTAHRRRFSWAKLKIR